MSTGLQEPTRQHIGSGRVSAGIGFHGAWFGMWLLQTTEGGKPCSWAHNTNKRHLCLYVWVYYLVLVEGVTNPMDEPDQKDELSTFVTSIIIITVIIVLEARVRYKDTI